MQVRDKLRSRFGKPLGGLTVHSHESFDVTQDHESFGFAQDHELVEWLVK
jgi:hypothetical protein